MSIARPRHDGGSADRHVTPLRQLEGIVAAIRSQGATYRQGADRPLGGYLVLTLAYAGVTGAGVALVRATGRRPPRTIPVRDFAYVGLATFQLARIITKKPITSTLRAPFTEFDGQSGPAELNERVRGHGLRHATGELLTCPFCIGHWIATAFGFGYVLAPDFTRIVAAMLSAEAAADFLQYGYSAVQQLAE